MYEFQADTLLNILLKLTVPAPLSTSSINRNWGTCVKKTILFKSKTETTEHMPEGKINHSVITCAGVRTDKQDMVV